MIYQFESEEIKNCEDCPCCDGISGCSLIDIPAVCPLVAISKTETTSCEWCEGELSFDVVWHSFGGSFVDKAIFCPNCGRRLGAHDERD